MKKIILFGGSFNPFHKSHEEIVTVCLETFQHDLWILPTYNPWKEKTFLNLEQRIKSLELLYSMNPRIKILSWCEDEQYNYSYKTVEKCYELGVKPILLMGTDAFASMTLWKNFNLIQNEETLVFNRSNLIIPGQLKVSTQLESSSIRKNWPQSKDQIPEAILDYIIELINKNKLVLDS